MDSSAPFPLFSSLRVVGDMNGRPFISPLRVPLMSTGPTAFSPLSEQQTAEIRPNSIEVAWPVTGGLEVRVLKEYAATSFWKIKLSLKNLCTSNSLLDLQTRTALKSWRRVSPSSIPDKPRCDAVAAFRLTTGHNCLAAHLHRLGIFNEPFCPLCDSGEVMERDHLLRCGALQGLTEMSRYWEARALLGQ
ncbi:hypothetical protein AVEN_10830-1 [Araneus ventricosus]|uniref:Uncharacterized protein n=1 Tax=Araneus ventricosus TaxID=182803 RepID=A0A4Y2FG58_ARAVE|nr:hypothetical protein AVEN_236194-1 [Araneus ventricosus]GBM39648.1 hypothetical protein AVEN_10830-1 [Araneus ventricosus]